MPLVLRSAETRLDLRSIAGHIAEDKPTAASGWLHEIERLFLTLADQPLIGQRIRTRRLGIVRRFSQREYLIYYRPLKNGVEILRVIHGMRDQGPLT